MDGTTLKQVPVKNSFWHGGVEFIKETDNEDELVMCSVAGKAAVVYIADHVWISLKPF